MPQQQPSKPESARTRHECGQAQLMIADNGSSGIETNAPQSIPTPREGMAAAEQKATAATIRLLKSSGPPIQNTENVLHLLLEAINEGALSLSPEGTILCSNLRFAEMIGVSPGKIIGALLSEFIEPAEQPRFESFLNRVPASGDKAEFNLVRGQGQDNVPVLLSLRPLQLEGGRVISIVATDLSTAKRHEASLRRQNAELEKRVAEGSADLTRANEALELAKSKLTENARDLETVIAQRTLALQEIVNSLEQFCYTIAHDLRAPLRTMHGFSTALLEDFAESLHPTASDYARRIVRAATRMDDQIRALLAYGRLNSADMPLIATDLAAATEEVSQAEEFRTARISILRPIPLVLANPTALRQVLYNLIANAVKFVAPRVVPQVGISAQDTAGWVRLSIQDNGIGIDPKYHQRIFRVFERVSTNEYPGTGIGLAIVQKGVDRMGGRVGVESVPGHGSRFWLDLRKAQPSAH